jgi:hypothetical protein
MKSFVRYSIVILMTCSLSIFTSFVPSAPALERYDIQITTFGKEALLQAIQQYSNLTEADVDQWKLSWMPVIGTYLRNSALTKIENFVKVCRSLPFAWGWFNNEAHLMTNVPANWDITKVCIALKNLDKQAEYALAILAQVATKTEVKLQAEINGYLKNIQYNQRIFGCAQEKQSRENQEQARERNVLDMQRRQEEVSTLYWHNWVQRWRLAKEVGNTAFGGAKWLIQTVHENSAPIISGAMALFIYNKLFGLSQRR